MTREPFTFGIALIARAVARDWALTEALLDLTLASILRQGQSDFRVVIAGHDRPQTRLDADPRLHFLPADWPPEEPGPHNVDSARKLEAISDAVLAAGGGLLAFVDADDWVDRDLVAAARGLPPGTVAATIRAGYATDLRSLRTAPLPHAGVFDGDFHRICGSSGVLRLDAASREPLRRNPFRALQPHHLWVENGAAKGVRVEPLQAMGHYLVNTSLNHSETHGPFADWRREFVRGVNREGVPTSSALAERFGMTLAQVRAVGTRFFGP